MWGDQGFGKAVVPEPSIFLFVSICYNVIDFPEIFQYFFSDKKDPEIYLNVPTTRLLNSKRGTWGTHHIFSDSLKKIRQGKSSLPLSVPHVVEHPVPHYEEAGDYHVGEQSCTEEHPGDQHFVLHADHARAGTVSAQVLTRIRS